MHLATNSKCCYIFNVGSGRSESFNTVIESLNNVLKTKLEPEYIDNPYAFFQTHTEADIKRAEQLLGYEPKYNLGQGVLAYHTAGAL